MGTPTENLKIVTTLALLLAAIGLSGTVYHFYKANQTINNQGDTVNPDFMPTDWKTHTPYMRRYMLLTVLGLGIAYKLAPIECDQYSTPLCKHYQTQGYCKYGRTHHVTECPYGLIGDKKE